VVTIIFMSRPAAVLGTVTAAVVLAACGEANAGGSDGPEVVAAFYPFAYVAERVAGEHASVANLTTAGAEPHDLELSPRQVVELGEADLVVYEHGFQPAVDDAMEQHAEGEAVEVTEVSPLSDTGAQGDDLDLHVWLDPTRLVPVAGDLADRLSELDPDHAAAYRSNAESLAADLADLDEEFRTGLAECERRAFVTSHAAFGYLADRYDMEMVPITGLDPDAEPSPARLAELRDVVADEGVTTVFTETLLDPSVAETLADEAGVEVGVLDPLEGLSDATAEEDYFSLMRANLTTLTEANGCR
jgi:zinc transport system substrate-binding protein